MIELRTGRQHQIVVDTAEDLREAQKLARFYMNDPRDPKAPDRIFFYDRLAAQYCGWAVKQVRRG
jgi:hypothetical protein